MFCTFRNMANEYGNAVHPHSGFPFPGTAAMFFRSRVKRFPYTAGMWNLQERDWCNNAYSRRSLNGRQSRSRTAPGSSQGPAQVLRTNWRKPRTPSL